MKKITRILSMALVAMMMLSLCAVAQADDTSAYIPAKLSKLGLDAILEDFEYPGLSIKITNLAKKYYYDENGKKQYILADPDYCLDPDASAENGAPTGYPQKVITEDSVAQFQFDEKPDWFGVNLSSLDGGWQNIDIDDNGYGELEIGELHRQPGMYTWYASGEGWAVQGSGGDYPYSGGKDYGDYAVTVSYHRDGSAYKVEVELKNGVDPFVTGLEVESVKVVFECVPVVTDCYADALVCWEMHNHMNEKEEYFLPRPQPMSVWYLSKVNAVYADGSYVAGVETDWRNDKKQNLASYRVTYAVSENAYYKITYAPKTTTIFENKTGALSINNGQVGVKYQWYDTTKGNNTGAFVKAELKYTKTVLGEGNEFFIPEPAQFTDLGAQNVCGAYVPSQTMASGDKLHHYTADEPIFGKFYKSRDDWKNDNCYACSGSGNNLKKWYQWNGTKKNNDTGIVHNQNGKQVKSIKKACTSFKSIRRLTK